MTRATQIVFRLVLTAAGMFCLSAADGLCVVAADDGDLTSILNAPAAVAGPAASRPLAPVPAATPDAGDPETDATRLSGALPQTPTDLPEYRLNIALHTHQRRVTVEQRVKWTNTGTAATSHLVFQVVANNKLSEEMIANGERTVESLRLDPRQSIDYEGRRFRLFSARLGDTNLKCGFSSQHDTHLNVMLPEPVVPGESVVVDLRYQIDIPEIMGRLGQHKGVTNLLNWYPVLCVYKGAEWKPVPYIPWHQPWYNEAGNYNVTLKLPADQRVVTGGRVTAREDLGNGYHRLTIVGEGLRDFTIVASNRFHEMSSEVNGIPIRVQYLPGNEFFARTAVRTAEESISLYSHWFGEYPYKEFELTESYFGWNGNESSGVVMIDARIFALPNYAQRYVEHLISHEICHQWWYSAVGTNGYHEPWMDEGLVTWFTRVKMEDKYGKNTDLLNLPGYGPFQFANVDYNTLVHSGYSLLQSRGGSGASLQSLDEFGHLHNLFFLVYDRGSRITGMIQQRLGRKQFFEFMRQLYANYRFRSLTVADFQAELEAYTGQDWQLFFDQWLRGSGSTDWAITDVEVTETERGYQTQARITQSGEITEPARIAVNVEGDPQPFRIATLSEAQDVQQNGVRVQRSSPNDWIVTVTSEEEPSQLTVDPDGVLVDSTPQNNTWRSETTVRVAPVYTPVDEAALLTPWNEQALVCGFGVDRDARIGLHGSLVSGNRYRISPFLAYTAATAARNADYISAGVDAAILNFPSPNWELRARYEHALLSTVANDPGHQARIALRRILNYTTSVIYPNLSYIDVYTRFGDNFFPDADDTPNIDPRVEQYNNVRAFGVEFHADSQLPYWDPDRGVRFDANYEHGFHAFGGGATYDRVSSQLGVVQRLSGAPGWLSETKLAGRVAGGYGWDDNGEHFRFGGPGRFRGRDATATEGNAFWLSSLEWRFPIGGEIDYQVLDNTAALNRVDGSIFYDVGRSYLMGDAQGKTDHAVGVGLYFQIPLLSFVENLTIRTEYGYSATNSTGAFWFGLYRAF